MKYFSLSLSLFVLLSFTACEDPALSGQTIKKEYYDSGKIRSKFILDDETGRNGLLKKYSDEGNLISTVEIRNGVKHGLEKGYDQNGRILWKKHHVKGELDLSKKSYYRHGAASERGSSRDSSIEEGSNKWKFAPQTISSRSHVKLTGNPNPPAGTTRAR